MRLWFNMKQAKTGKTESNQIKKKIEKNGNYRGIENIVKLTKLHGFSLNFLG